MSSHNAFPDRLPPQIEGPSAWFGPDMAARSDEWLLHFTETELAEIASASLAYGEADIASMRREDFPLPSLRPRLQAILAELLNGRGFVLLRGLPVQRWSLRQSAVAFYGLGLHLGRARPQNAQGHVLGHVKDLGLSSDDPRVRIYQTHERQTFHTDSSDIVGLLCLQTARSGGRSALVSSVTLYNELRRLRPDLAALLFQPLATDRRGEVPAGGKPFFEIPVFSWHAGLLSAIYQRQYIDSAQRFADAPRLGAETVEALDLFDALSNDTRLNFMMSLEPGDLQFVHNHSLLHDRTAFEDWPEPERQRHLLRLWLAPESARPLPPVFAQRYGSLVPGERGGVTMVDLALNAPLAVD
ncbi:TauD/TfdA family dioxygenase [Roseateles toxinivorans]|uniref:TfdA family taurine catabolism dioxygenase TauD n=1 Tax=Roseateles toxinivorans TaxID=270368 RepID=A0A4R6QJW8_9BURK|nr:TauD/TfdA family dioxygenase [Roseateles toxinivorans]TDP64026.1 TfdA family taurine catabolism dioxygenase TauD [Roseateles toxinivorans]